MGYIYIIGPCVACGQIIHYNPHHVPSLRINRERQALCKNCHALWNQIHRTDKGLEPIPLHPLAYEPMPEEEF